MQKRNYSLELEKLISSLSESEPPTLLLHSCCAPCSSYTLEYLTQHFSVTIFYYNPNITEAEEYYRRVEEQKRLINDLPVRYPVSFIEGDYCPEDFFSAVKGLEHIPEGGGRCFACYRLRLEKTSELAAAEGFDYFGTTLSISPYKNASKLNEISGQLAEIYSVKPLPLDLKKRGGYKRSIELSAQYSLYRQDYCGCIFSKREAEFRRKKKEHTD